MAPSSPNADKLAAEDPLFYAMQEAVYEVTGKRVPFARDTRIDRYFIDVVGADSLEYLDLSFTLQDKLGVWIDDKDWNFLTGSREASSLQEWELKFAPLFTFGRLTDLIASRARFAPPAPVTILGATSNAAGAFRYICEAAREVAPRVKSFGPSTAIHERFKGRKLRRLWERLRMMSCGRIPPLKATRYERIADFMSNTGGVLTVIGLSCGSVSLFSRIYGFGATVDWLGWLFMVLLSSVIIAGFFAVVAVVLAFVVRRLGKASFNSNLPNGIATFRDLSELIAGDRGGWCDQCGYDLTGLTGDVCPECGKNIAHPIGK
ncbi:hypothetical protein RAS2_03690 [Phycisphaerae bacterium RAS2]|nr:hypothetical protein RAS2_03690 [Phycisphaerae bacterium RAS2]